MTYIFVNFENKNNLKTMNELIQLNKNAIYDKLKNVHKIADNYVANDLIDAVSTHKERDKKLINGWGEDEVFIQKTVRGNSMRLVRLFTMKGIARYLQEGKVYSYENLCKYFNIQPIDKELEKLKKELNNIKAGNGDNIKDGDGDTYQTNKILKWLFESRVQAKSLGSHTTKEKLTEWLNSGLKDIKNINKKKLQLLKIELDELSDSDDSEFEFEFEIDIV